MGICRLGRGASRAVTAGGRSGRRHVAGEDFFSATLPFYPVFLSPALFSLPLLVWEASS